MGGDGGALWAAAHSGDALEVRKLLAAGADPNVTGTGDGGGGGGTGTGDDGGHAKERLSALHWASWKGNVEIVGALLAHGADHRSVNKWGKTPLHWAAWMGHSDVASVLMSHGADPSVLDDDGWTPLHLAARFNQPDTVVVMLGSGANPETPDKLGQTARELAVQLNYGEVVAAFDAQGTLNARSEARLRNSPGSDLGLASRTFASGDLFVAPPSLPPVSPPRLTGSGASLRADQHKSPLPTPHHSGPSGLRSSRSNHDAFLEQRYQAKEMLERARMEADAAVHAAQAAADDRVKAAEQRSAQALSEALADKARQQETIEHLRQEMLELEAEVAAGKAAQSSLLLERQDEQDAMARARAQMDATVSSIQSAANDRVVDAEKRTAQVRDEYHADTSRLQDTIDQLRQTVLETQTETANVKAAHDNLQSELRHAEENMSRARADVEETVASVQKSAAQQMESRVATVQRAADRAEKLLAEERRLKEESMAREKECKQRLAEEKRAAWSRLEDERRKLEEERRRHIELSGQIDALTAEVEFMRSSSRASVEAEAAQLRVAEQMDETSRKREAELEELKEKQRALQAAEGEIAGRLHDCEAREQAATAAETRARAESENAAVKLKQVEQASTMVKAMQDDSAKAAQAAEKEAVARVATVNARLHEVLDILGRTKQSVAVAVHAKDEAVAQANEASATADQRAADLQVEMQKLEEECQRRLAAAEAMCDNVRKELRESKLSHEQDIKRQHKELDGRIELVAAQEKQAQASKEAAKELLEEVELAVASTKSSQADVEKQVKDELAQAKLMVVQAQKNAQSAVQSAEGKATERVHAISVQLEEAGTKIEAMQEELDTLRSDRAKFEQVAQTIAEQQEELQQDMLSKQEQLERSNAKLEDAQHLAAQLADEVPASAAEVDSMKEQGAALHAELQAARSRADELERENRTAQMALTAAVEQQEKLAAIFEQRVAEKTADQEVRARMLEQENLKAREAITAVIAEQEEMARTFAEKLEGQAKAADKLEAEKLELESRLAETRERTRALEVENQEAKERVGRVVQEQEQAVANATSTLAQREGECKEQVKAMQSEAAEWKRKYETSEAANRESRDSMADTLQRQMTAEAMQLASAEKARKRAEARLGDASSELEALSRECAEAQDKVAERNTAVARLELEKEQAEKTLEEAYNSLRQHAERIAKVEHSSRVDKESIEQYRQDLSDCRMQLEESQKYNVKLQKETQQKQQLINEAWQAVHGQAVQPHKGFLLDTLKGGSPDTPPPGIIPLIDQEETRQDASTTTKDTRTQLFQSRRHRQTVPGHKPEAVGGTEATDFHPEPEPVPPQLDAATSALAHHPSEMAAWGSEPSPPRHRSPEPTTLSDQDMQHDSAQTHHDDGKSPLSSTHIYRVLRPAITRAGFARDSAKTGAVRQGQFIEVRERRHNSLGQLRLRCHSGWLSETARNGEPLLEFVELTAVHSRESLIHECPLLFRALRGASVREGRARTSRRLAQHAVVQGEIVEAVEGWRDSESEHSTVRWRLRGRGWVSETAANGSVLLELLGCSRHHNDTDGAEGTSDKGKADTQRSKLEVANEQQPQPPEPQPQQQQQHREDYNRPAESPDLPTSSHAESAAQPTRRPHAVWETDPNTHTQAVAVHYSPKDMAKASENAAMTMVRNAMAAGRRLFGHSLRDTYAAFRAFDRDGSGLLSREEFSAAMGRLDLGLSTSQLSTLFDSVDADNSGAIDYAEYAAALWHAHGTGPGSQHSDFKTVS